MIFDKILKLMFGREDEKTQVKPKGKNKNGVKKKKTSNR